MENQNTDQEKLPKPELDLPLPRPLMPEHSDGGRAEKEIPDHFEDKPKLSILKSKFFLSFVALSVLIAFVIGGFALGRNSVFKELNPAAPAIPPPDEPSYQTPTPDPTADWETYYDPDNLFSIEYPSDTSVEKDLEYNLITANTVPVVSISREEGDRNTNTPEWYRVQIYIENNPNNLSAQQIIDAYLKKINQPQESGDKNLDEGNKLMTEASTTKIKNSMKNYKNGEIEGVYALYGADYNYNIIVQTKNGKIFTFLYTGLNSENVTPPTERIITQILSTLKFTGENPSPSPDGKFCGGIMGKACPEGYICKLDGNYPDAGGTCVIK